MKIIGMGDNVVDRYIDERIMFPGGNCVNFAVYTKELGEDSAYMGLLADDKEGQLIKESLIKKGVDISSCIIDKNAGTERCDVELREGDRVFVGTNTGGNDHKNLELTDDLLKILDEYDVVHGCCYADMEDHIKKLKDHKGIVTYDFSEEDEYRTDEYLNKICPYIDIALFSASHNTEEEISELKNKCLVMGASMVLVTKGSKGQTLFVGNKRYEGTVREVKPVDTMGAGDSFFAAFIVSLLKGGFVSGEEPTEKNVADAFVAGAEFAAKNCLREGAFGFATKY